MRLTTSLLALVSVAITGCANDPRTPLDPGDPGPLGEQVRLALADIAHVPQPAAGLEYNIYELDQTSLDGDVTAASCDAVDNALAEVCSDLQGLGEVDYCGYETAFFYANDIPRCAVRFHTFWDEIYEVAPMHVLDFSGTPIQGAVPTCGNGVLDEAEECDDGNHELWDGCDSNCVVEPFNGCEAVIQDYYQQSGLAMVDQYQWDGARSHLMVNRQAVAIAEVNQQTCQAAIATADDVCRELVNTMDLVSYCQPSGRYHVEDSGAECSIRLNVWFGQLDGDAGVYTTSLPGVLAFTIR